MLILHKTVKNIFMKTYTKRELALIIHQIINNKYSNPEYFYEQLKTNIKAKIKANSKTVLTDDEYYKKGLGFAQFIIGDLNLITIQQIEFRLSTDVIKEASVGIEIANYNNYFLKAAKEIIREFSNAKFKIHKAKNKKHNGNRK